MAIPKPQVLIVDDDLGIRKMWTEVLELEGYPTQSAVNGTQGLHLMRQTLQPAVVITGLMMPVMDGWDMLRIAAREGLLERHSVVVISGNARTLWPLTPDWSLRWQHKSYKEYADVRRICTQYDIEILAKPHTVDQLFDAVERAVMRLNSRTG